MSNLDNAPKRLLIVRNDRIGDVLLTLPTLALARKMWPNAYIAVLVTRLTAELLQNNPWTDEVLIDSGPTSVSELADLLKSHDFDTAMAIVSNTRNCLAIWKAGIPQRVCSGYKFAGFLLGNRRIFLHRNSPPVHESEYAMAFVRKLAGMSSIDLKQQWLFVPAGVKERIRKRLENDLPGDTPLFGLNPGNFKGGYNWPLQRYVELALLLIQHGRVVVFGGPGEKRLLEEFRDSMKLQDSSRFQIYGDLGLLELSAAIQQLDVLVVANTGPMHLAGILDVPVVALFSAHPAQSPEKWAPLGDRQTIIVAPLDANENANIPNKNAIAHMARISALEVFRAAMKWTSVACSKDAA